MQSSTFPFKSAEGEAAYKAAYDRTLALWGVAYECREISTRFGLTHVIASGPKDSPPLILLPAMGVSSTFWFPNVTDLSRDFRTFAVDVIGDLGRSVPADPPKNRAGYGEWLLEVLNGLHLQRAHLAGLSYGGFLTLNFALRTPDRVQRIVLLSPAASLARLRIAFWLRGLSMLVLPGRAALNSFMRWASVKEDIWKSAAVDQIFLGMRSFRARLSVLPAVFTDDELRSLSVPTLLLVGEHEVIYDPRAAVERARRCIPQLEAEIIPNAGHLLTFDQPEVVDARMARFLRP